MTSFETEQVSENCQPAPGQMGTRTYWIAYPGYVAGFGHQEDRIARAAGTGDTEEEALIAATRVAAMSAETEMVPVTELYVRCSYPLRPDVLAASDTCQHPADTAVQDTDGNLWYRCPSHEGELRNGVYGEKVVTCIPRRSP